MLVEYPHHRSSAVVRGQTTRRLVHFTMFGDSRAYTHRAWADHRIQMVTSGDTLRRRVALEFPTRASRELVWRVETARKDYDAGWGMARRLAATIEGEPGLRACLVDGVRGGGRYKPLHLVLPASHLRLGMMVAVVRDGRGGGDGNVSPTVR